MFSCLSISADPIPQDRLAFLNKYCLDCHDTDTKKGEVVLEFSEIAWERADVNRHWERVLKVLDSGAMPPEGKRQPTAAERESMVKWLDDALTRHADSGGTVPRRLNRDEYANTIQSLFGMSFELPDGFPQDTDDHHFDTEGDALILSPTLMAAYLEAATLIADEIFPPARLTPESRIDQIPVEELVISYSSGSVREGAMRLASQCSSMMRSCTWPSKVEIRHSGRYRICVDASVFKPHTDEPMLLKILARDVASKDSVNVNSLRELHQIEVTQKDRTAFVFEADLYEGQTIVFYYANAPLDSDRQDKATLQAWFRAKFERDPRYLAAWQRMTRDDKRGGFRGGLGWERVKRFMDSNDLDMSQSTLDSEATQKLLKAIAGNPVLYTETIAYDSFKNGPAIEIHHATVEGPLESVDGPRDITRKKIQAGFLGRSFDPTDAGQVQAMLGRFLTRAFRRPAEPEILNEFHRMLQAHQVAGHTFEKGMHLVLRAALVSPRFLYREMAEGELDDYDIASRLAYFLTSKPPDDKLLKTAAGEGLRTAEGLREQAKRLLPRSASSPMVRRFTSQWLDTKLLDEIMPDPRLKFTEDDQQRAREEVEMFFAEMIKANRPMTDFIMPDFTFTSASIAKKIYGLGSTEYDPKNKSMQEVSLPRQGPYGGVLGQAAVLMATANGVDTQPVLRGVWVLENVLGDPPPPPPQAVPAITPDTTGAKTPRDLLEAHASQASCAACHKKIDPIGYVLENFDAVGRWRETYPVWSTDKKGRPISKPGMPIDPAGQMPDGTPISNSVDLKRWIVLHIDQFSQCLAEKLMTYATGREPSYIERKEIASIIEQNHQRGNGFQDLLLELICSQTFRTK